MLVVLIIFVWVLLGLALGVRLKDKDTISGFELARRSQHGDQAARALLIRRKREPELESLRRIIITLLSSIIVTLSVLSFGRWPGIIAGTLLLLTGPLWFRLRMTNVWADKLSQKLYHPALGLVEKIYPLLHVLRPRDRPRHQPVIHSKEELADITRRSHAELSQSEIRHIHAAMDFHGHTARDIMTPMDEIVLADIHDTLGPLVLHDLHETGHSIFPVIDLNQVVGLLDISSQVDMKSPSRSVREAMDTNVLFVAPHETLESVARLFAETHAPLVIVSDDDNPLGLISLQDLLEAMLGQNMTAFSVAHR